MPDDEKKPRGFSTKYALTTGVQEVEIDVNYGSYAPDAKYIYYRMPGSAGYHVQLVRGVDFFDKREDAVADAKQRAHKKVASLHRQLERVKKMTREEKWAKK